MSAFATRSHGCIRPPRAILTSLSLCAKDRFGRRGCSPFCRLNFFELVLSNAARAGLTGYARTLARELAAENNLILICGHYEGFDERIREYVDLEISIGDYVLTGGELASMVIVDSVVRLIPGVLGDDTSSQDESFSPSTSLPAQAGSGSARLLEYPQYTRPKEFEGKKVPEILLSGNHREIDKWRKEQAQERTTMKRPDLLKEKLEIGKA